MKWNVVTYYVIGVLFLFAISGKKQNFVNGKSWNLEDLSDYSYKQSKERKANPSANEDFNMLRRSHPEDGMFNTVLSSTISDVPSGIVNGGESYQVEKYLVFIIYQIKDATNTHLITHIQQHFVQRVPVGLPKETIYYQ